MNPEIVEFSNRLRLLAKEFGGIRALSKKTDTSERTLANWLSCKTDPKATALKSIADATGVSLNWLIMGQGKMKLDSVETIAPENLIDQKRWEKTTDKLVTALEEQRINPDPRKMAELLMLTYTLLDKIEEEEAQKKAAESLAKAAS